MDELNELDSMYAADPRLAADPNAKAKQRMLTQRILAALAQQYKNQQPQVPIGQPQSQQQQQQNSTLFNSGQGIGALFGRLF